MYKSPIDIVYGQMQTQMEGDILRAVQSYGINVDKEELIRALEYDRGQYYKGYDDATPKWIPVTERLPEEDKPVLAWTNCGSFCESAKWTGYGWNVTWDYEELFEVTHWMPLPEPPKGE